MRVVARACDQQCSEMVLGARGGMWTHLWRGAEGRRHRPIHRWRCHRPYTCEQRGRYGDMSATRAHVPNAARHMCSMRWTRQCAEGSGRAGLRTCCRFLSQRSTRTSRTFEASMSRALLGAPRGARPEQRRGRTARAGCVWRRVAGCAAGKGGGR